MPAPQKIIDLVEHFERDKESLLSAGYNETRVRREFIDPFFRALGWDIENAEGVSEAYKDVIHEDAIRIGGAHKAPDYCMRIEGIRKFFVEAKKPSVNLKDDAGPAIQVRRYAWSAKLPLSLLTDFQELAIYDCRIRPLKNDNAAKARILYFTYKEYIQKWDEIASIFSREAVQKGSFDAYAEKTKQKKGSEEVDEAFLKEIEKWRELLAKNIAVQNPTLSQRELNYAVQVTIDRLVFLRICEDRGIERYSGLLGEMNGPNIYGRLKHHFRSADDRYNSGLFHFENEKDQSDSPDTLTLSLTIDDAVLKEIISHLYYPESPYEFSVVSADILGQVYEQFLGKVIRLTDGHHAKIEEKPEVRKAGGVYYTPTYIVQYIVKNTVGKLVEGKTHKEVANLKICDPACGSGSFLLGAYQFLLDWHLKFYTENMPKKPWKELCKGPKGDWKLTTAERKRILLSNIYGVDIDAQAVEVTKLSLLLKVLEGETEQSLQTTFLHERVLPNLGSNIKCGNSLIGSDFENEQQQALFELNDEEKYKINIFDWESAFTEIFARKNPGFDAVIGNPPYLFSATQEYQAYFSKTYHFCQYQTDFYSVFIERAFHLCRTRGLISYIVSDSWLNSENFSKLRDHLLTKHALKLIAIFDYPVFRRATIENSIFVVIKDDKPSIFAVDHFASPNSIKTDNSIDPKNAVKDGMINPRSSHKVIDILKKIEKGSIALGTLVRLNRGIHAYRTDGYGKTKFGSGFQTTKDKEQESYHADRVIDSTYLPEIKGKNVFRYYSVPSGKYLSYGDWLAEPRQSAFFMKPKIAIRKILSAKLCGSFFEKPTALDQSLYVLISPEEDVNLLINLLGILLSRLAAWYLQNKYAIFDTLYPWYTKKQLSDFPIKKPPSLLKKYVENMMLLQQQAGGSKTPHEQESFKRQIEATDHQIDQLVFELYGLSKEEQDIVRKTTS